MSDTYADEMFDFFTSKENFELVSNIYEQFDDVRNKLLSSFWELVIEKVEMLITGTNWIMEFTEDGVDLTSGALYLYKPNHFPEFAEDAITWVSYENISGRVYAHLYRNIEYIDIPNETLTKILADIKKYKKPRTAKEELCYIHTDDDFSYAKSLKKILPYNKELLADNYAKLIFDMANDLTPIMDKLVSMAKK